MLRLTAGGSVSDYSDTSSLQQSIATVAAVEKSAVEISVAAGSVRITASIAVPASTTATAMQLLLSTSLGTATAASAQLGITVEELPTIEIRDDPQGMPKSPGVQGLDATMFALLGSAGVVAAAILAACYVARRRRLKKQRSAWSGKVDPTLTSYSDSMIRLQADLPHLAPGSAYTAVSRIPDKGVLLDGTAQLRTGMAWYRCVSIRVYGR